MAHPRELVEVVEEVMAFTLKSTSTNHKYPGFIHSTLNVLIGDVVVQDSTGLIRYKVVDVCTVNKKDTRPLFDGYTLYRPQK